ncbi:MAG: hypothetical protein J0L75_19780 [Spirochaetes bacterium]|nr:hypothetical protein [Spirochaetota bacterium]
MSLRPIDFQTLLNQMGEVGKKEDARIKRRQEDKDRIDAKTRTRQTEEPKSEKSAMEGDLVKAPEPVKPEKNKHKHKPPTGPGPRKGLQDDFKGNFLDITE